MIYQYTTADYLAAIDRELAKRATTYPKILAKMIKKDVEFEVYDDAVANQADQIIWLKSSRIVFDTHIDFSIRYLVECFEELLREYQMRRKCYPRFIMFKRITAQTAEYEISLWRELTVYFAKNYLGDDAMVAIEAIEMKPKKRTSHANPG